MTLGTVVGSAELVLVNAPTSNNTGPASTGDASWRDTEVTGLYLVDRADAEASCAQRLTPLRNHLVVLAHIPSSAEGVQQIVAHAAARRAAGILSSAPPGLTLSASCLQHGLPLFVMASRRPAPECVTQIVSLILGDLRDRLTAADQGDIDGPEDFDKLLHLLDQGARSVGADLQLVTPGALVNPALALSPVFRTAALASPIVQVSRLPKAGRVVHLGLERSGGSLLLTRETPCAWSSQRVAAVVAAFNELMSSVAASRGVRSVMERTFIRELVARDPATVGPWASSLGLVAGARVSGLVIDFPGDENFAGVIENAVRDVGLATLRPVIAAARQGRVLALVPRSGAHDDVLDQAVDHLGMRLGELLGHPAAVGTSSCVFTAPDDLVHALVSAGQIAERNRFNIEVDVEQVIGTQGWSARMKVPLAAGLLATADATTILADPLLAPLLTNDSRHGSNYVQTLRTHLVLDCRMAETAVALGIHVNTLRYRLNRIEALTGRDLHVTADLVDFYLALILREPPHHGSAGVGGNSATVR